MAANESEARSSERFDIRRETITSPSTETVETPPKGRRTRRRVFVVLGLVLLMALAGVGYIAVRQAQERPIHEALENAHAAFAEVEQEVADATDVPALNAAGAQAALASGTVSDELQRIEGKGGDLADAARAVLTAQVAYLEGIEGLSGLSEDTLTEWGDTALTLTTAEVDLTSAVERLAEVDPEDAALVAPDSDGREHVIEIVGTFLNRALAGATNDLLRELSTAKTTAEIRAVAAKVGDTTAMVDASADGLPDDSPALAEVEAYGAALAQIARLSTLGRESLERWDRYGPEFRKAVTSATGLGAGADAAQQITKIVESGKKALRAWETARDAAIKAQRADLATLREYRANILDQFERYAALREALSNFIGRIEASGGTYGGILTNLGNAITARTLLRAELAVAAPTSVEDAYPGDLVDLVGESITIITDVRDAFTESRDVPETDEEDQQPQLCTEVCRPRDIPGWAGLHGEESDLAPQVAAIKEEWIEVANKLRGDIQDRKLPVKPTV